jgi:hypothetical protein
MKTLRRAVLILAAMLGFCGISQAQVALTQTTLASSVSGPAFYSGGTVNIDQTIFLSSVTGISAPSLPGSPVSIIYVGREAMGVFTVNTSLKSVNVFRGYLGTQAGPHPNGDMVLISNVYATNQAFGGNILPSGFFQVDPPANGACTAAGTPTTPWLNVLTGGQWICSSITKTWVPGFVNTFSSGEQETATVPAAAGTVLPSGPLFVISGAGAITGFTIPIGCNATAVGQCTFTVIAAAGSTWTWTAAGNIMTAGTGTAGHTFTFTWSASLQKFVPSSLS